MPSPEVISPVAIEMHVRGIVQGVGFRPYVFRLAHRLGLAGWVRNDSHGATVHVEGQLDAVVTFRNRLRRDAPDPSQIETVDEIPTIATGATEFRIETSSVALTLAARVPPDRATCACCKGELFDHANRRFLHPFANCTACGPRYTILESLPYDRMRTTMRDFSLCDDCTREYADPHDRRFHAQPLACPSCGPGLSLRIGTAGDTANDAAALSLARDVLRSGGILAVKGLGGFQLLVRADNPKAVRRLRIRKHRPTKPFAIMVSSVADARRLARIDREQEDLLASAANPIVLLERNGNTAIAAEVAPFVGTVGLMLPTTPLHHILLADLEFPVVATSGNRSGEPIAVSGAEATGRLGEIADAFLDHDRAILRRTDDSVVRVVAGRPMSIRLARGYAPLPLPHLERWAAARNLPPVLAVGGQQKTALALWTGTQAVLGPHIGDLDDALTLTAFETSTQDFTSLYACRPAAIACDSHPDYASTRWAERSGIEWLRVQHHHAHAAAVMVEHDLLDREVLAITWDGTGFGDDGTLWGGEMLRVTLTSYTRVASLLPITLIGGEAAVLEPARIALVLAAAAVGASQVLDDRFLLERLGLSTEVARSLLRMAEQGIRCPTSTGMGRLIDGLAALVLPFPRVTYEAEAAIQLEVNCANSAESPYSMPTAFRNSVWCGDWRPLVVAVLGDLRRGVPVDRISSRIHRTLAAWAGAIAARCPDLPVVLGGGCFQNHWLTAWVRSGLEAEGRIVYQPERIPSNDGGLAAGQLAVALARLAEAQDAQLGGGG